MKNRWFGRLCELLLAILLGMCLVWSQVGVLDKEIAYRDALLARATDYGE